MKYKKDDPRLPAAYLNHVKKGNSGWSFASNVVGGLKAFSWLIKNNKDFQLVHSVYGKKAQVKL